MTISHKAAAHAWMDANPSTMDWLYCTAMKAKGSGIKRIGIAFLIERLRWFQTIEQRAAHYKVDNSHRAEIARELERRHEDLRGFFVKRVAGQEAA